MRSQVASGFQQGTCSGDNSEVDVVDPLTEKRLGFRHDGGWARIARFWAARQWRIKHEHEEKLHNPRIIFRSSKAVFIVSDCLCAGRLYHSISLVQRSGVSKLEAPPFSERPANAVHVPCTRCHSSSLSFCARLTLILCCISSRGERT